MPPTESYQISSTSPSLRPSSKLAFMAVSRRRSFGLFKSKLTTSPGSLGVERIPTAIPFLLTVEVLRICVPVVTCLGAPPLTDSNQRLLLPLSSAVKYIPLLSSAQNTPPGERSKSAVKTLLPPPSAFIKQSLVTL